MSATEPNIVTPLQTRLPLVIAQRTVLVGVETVRAKFGCDAESVFAMVDNGTLRWAFDVAVTPGKGSRELRFWTGEIIAPENAARQTAAQVIAAIIGKGASVRRGEIERQWICSAQHIMRLIRAGELTLASRSKISRESLARFLHERLPA